MLPAVLLAGAGVAVGAAITYYFVSNNANAKREELTRQMEATLRALVEKAEALKEAIRTREEALRAAAETNAAMAADIETLRKMLKQTEQELDSLRTETDRWSVIPSSFASKLALVTGSGVLRKAGWKHDKAMAYLVERQHHAEGALITLRSSQ